MSQKLTSGNSKYSIFYLIVSLINTRFFDWYWGTEKFLGDITRGNPNIPLTENCSLISLNDPALDYRECVATLPNSSLWGNSTIVDDKGDKIVIIPMSNEGHLLDYRPRIFGIKELSDGTVDTQELISTDAGISSGSQLYTYEQDAVGNVYL